MDQLKEVSILSFSSSEYKLSSSGEHYYEESLRDCSGLFALTEEDMENQDILRPDDLCIFKKNINMGKKDKTVRTIVKFIDYN